MTNKRTLYEELDEFQRAWGRLVSVLGCALVQFALIPVRFALWLNGEV